jgi:DNA-binding MarR family transcriptional regulator
MNHESTRPTTGDRRELVGRLRDAIDDMGWRNLRIAERMLAPHGLTFPQVIVLALLDQHGPELEMSQIAARTGLPASTITGIMDRLVARGFAVRHQSETDRRRITGSVAEDGVRVLRELDAARVSTLSRLVEDFTLEEIALLTRLIDRWTTISEEYSGLEPR